MILHCMTGVVALMAPRQKLQRFMNKSCSPGGVSPSIIMGSSAIMTAARTGQPALQIISCCFHSTSSDTAMMLSTDTLLTMLFPLLLTLHGTTFTCCEPESVSTAQISPVGDYSVMTFRCFSPHLINPGHAATLWELIDIILSALKITGS